MVQSLVLEMSEVEERLRRIAQAIVDKKGFNVVALDVRGISTITDYFLIAEGNVERHIKALANAVQDELDDQNVRVEGLGSPDWVVLDCWEIVVHLFTPDMRQKYQIERIWEEANLVNLELDFPEKEKPAIKLQ